MPTPAAGSELRTALSKTPEITPSRAPADAGASRPLQRLRAGDAAARLAAVRDRPRRARAGAAPRRPDRGPGRRSRWSSSSASTPRPRARSPPAPCSAASPGSTPRPGRAPPGRPAAAPLIGVMAALGILTSPVGAAGGGDDGPGRGRSPATASPTRCASRSTAWSAALTLLVSQGLFLAGRRRRCRRCSGAPSAASPRCSGRCSSGSSSTAAGAASRAAGTAAEVAAGLRAPTSPWTRRTSATRSASAPRWRSASPSTAPSTWTTTASGSR